MWTLEKRIARLWLSKRAVYIVKLDYAFLSCRDAMACVYEDVPSLHWMEEPDVVQAVMTKIVDIYDLRHYDMQLVLSGEYLQWKVIEVSSKDGKEAYDEVAWDDALAQQADSILYDIERPTKEFDESGYLWVVGAYSKSIASALYLAIRASCKGKIEITFLPQYIGAILEETNGIVTIWEKGMAHRFYLRKGQVHQYDCHDEPPFDEEEKTLGFSLHYQATATDTPKACHVRKNVETFCKTYDIRGPAMLLMAPPKKRMNIAPKQEKRHWKEKVEKALPLAVLIEGFLFLIVCSAYGYTAGLVKEKQAYYEEVIEPTQRRIHTYNEMEKRKTEQAKVLQAMMESHRNWPGLLVALTESKPDDVIVVSSQSSQQGIHLQVQAKEARSLQTWQGKLRKSPFFSNVTLGKIRKDPVKGHEGIVQLEMQHDKNEEE